MVAEQSRFRQAACLAAIIATTSGVASPLLAQTAATAPTAGVPPISRRASDAVPGLQLEEVVVTAQRRAERLQKVPIAITALPATQLKAAGITSTQGLAAVTPGLSVATNGPSQTLFIRGVGADTGNINQEPSVAVYVDDVYIASPTQTAFALNNIAQISVLKGPQGTLFGRNATGGVIQITTRDPTDTPRVDAEVGYGNYNTTSGSLYVSGPLAANVVGDLAINGSTQQDGWGRSVITGERLFRPSDIDARTKFIWTPDSATKVRLELDYDQSYTGGFPFRGLPGEFNVDGQPAYAGFYNSRTNTPSNIQRLTGGASMRVDHDFGGFRGVSITAYRQLVNQYSTDEDKSSLTVVDATLHEKAHNYSQEFQILSPQQSRLSWVVGAFLYKFTSGDLPAAINGLAAFPLPFEDINSTAYTDSGSVYAQATTEVLPDTHLTGGLRYTIERQYDHASVTFGPLLLAGPFHERQGFDKATWRIALDHQFTPDLLGYISYNRGIKSGGFDVLSPGTPGYRPEQLDAYEAGFKGEFLDHRLRVNTSAYYYDYKNIQEELAITGGTITANAGEAHIYGLDFDSQLAVTRNFKLYGSASYLHSRYFRYADESSDPGNPGAPTTGNNVQGNDTPQAPHFTGDIGGSYTIATTRGDFVASGVYSYNNGFYWDSSNRLTQPAYFLVNAQLSWVSPGGRYGANVYGRNLTGAHYYAQQIESTGLGDLSLPAPPRTYGFALSVHY